MFSHMRLLLRAAIAAFAVYGLTDVQAQRTFPEDAAKGGMLLAVSG